LDNLDKAMELLDPAWQKDPLDFRLGYERLLCLMSMQRFEDENKAKTDLSTRMRGFDWSYLELADDYIQAGLYNESSGLLQDFMTGVAAKDIDPMVYYTLAWLYWKTGDNLNMKKCLDAAAGQSTDYCFPYMNGSITVLEKAIELKPGDARAHYTTLETFCSTSNRNKLWNAGKGVYRQIPHWLSPGETWVGETGTQRKMLPRQ
jgi:tetratricopeptide (TPR) repeat protein